MTGSEQLHGDTVTQCQCVTVTSTVNSRHVDRLGSKRLTARPTRRHIPQHRCQHHKTRNKQAICRCFVLFSLSFRSTGSLAILTVKNHNEEPVCDTALAFEAHFDRVCTV